MYSISMYLGIEHKLKNILRFKKIISKKCEIKKDINTELRVSSRSKSIEKAIP